MAQRSYILEERKGKRTIAPARELKKQGDMAVFGQKVRLEVIRLLSKKRLYPAEIARILKLDEQRVYYHIRKLTDAGIIQISDEKRIRGTLAKRYTLKEKNFIIKFGQRMRPLQAADSSILDDQKSRFLAPLLDEGSFAGKVIVGSPDPHGPHKARARDGHYAIDLALDIGSIASLSEEFTVGLDVKTSLQDLDCSIISVGGPVTNMITARLNENLPFRFTQEQNWGIMGRRLYTEDNVGLIARVPNPFNPSLSAIILAGIRFSGTKTAVIALTRYPELALSRFSGEEPFGAIVQGFDLDGDGEIDSIELLD